MAEQPDRFIEPLRETDEGLGFPQQEYGLLDILCAGYLPYLEIVVGRIIHVAGEIP